MAEQVTTTNHPESEPDVSRKENPRTPDHASGRHFKIKHTQVGPWTEGRTISELELQERYADIHRLISLGAIEETKDDLTSEPLDAGPENRLPPPEAPAPPQNAPTGPAIVSATPSGTLSSGEQVAQPPAGRAGAGTRQVATGKQGR